MLKIFCSKCGEKLPEDAKFCIKCGTPVKVEVSEKTVVETFRKDPNLQDHWIKRLIAYIIDSIIVGAAAALLLIIVLFPIFITNPASFFNLFSFPFAMGILYIVYFTLTEAFRGATIGKGFFGLKVVAKTGENLTLESAFIRNISKIHWVLLLLDLVGGLITSTDLHQKYSDKLANTTVTS